MSDEDVALDQTIPEGCRVVLLSPTEIHFSQTRIRDAFQDGRLVAETIPTIKAGPIVDRAKAKAAADAGVSATEATEDLSESQGRPFQLLSHPFPRIEVTRWRCKLREADGQPRLDPATGLELYSQEEHFFSFDNRRLYCLQKAAALLWPQEVRCEVVELPANMARTRELRKFDTRTFGLSVIVGPRDDPDATTSWNWRTAVGLPEESQPEIGIARQKSARWRGRPSNRGAPNSGRRRSQKDQEEEGQGTSDIAHNALIFFLVYLGLRLVVSFIRQYVLGGGSSGGSAAPPAVPPPPPPAA